MRLEFFQQVYPERLKKVPNGDWGNGPMQLIGAAVERSVAIKVLRSTIIAGFVVAAVLLPRPLHAEPISTPVENQTPPVETVNPTSPLVQETAIFSIPPGTTITSSNWEQYKQFFTEGEIGLWQGRWFWKMPADVQINVGPTKVFPLPEPFVELSEKYGDQTQLVRMSDGRWQLKNYAAGMPFPVPREPNMGLKILANLNYRIAPHLVAGFSDSGTVGRICEIDRYGSTSCVHVDYDFRQMAYNWEPGVPRVEPDSGAAWLGEWVQAEEPEQLRYTADLVLQWQDNLRPEGHYAFIPALRRSMRLSDTSHCEPLLSSTDRPRDDSERGWGGRASEFGHSYDTARGWFEPVMGMVPNSITSNNYFGGVPTTSPQQLSVMHGAWNGGIGDFDVTSVKRQKLLALTQLTAQYGKFPDSYDMPLGWARPSWGTWELRNVWVIEVHPIPLIARCQRKRMIYVDTSLSAPLAEDLYDDNMNLSKVMVLSSQPSAVPGFGMQTWAGGGILQLWDVQSAHALMSLTTDERGRNWSIDSAVKPQYNSISEFQSPGGLMELMR
jgi:hypothetical protein